MIRFTVVMLLFPITLAFAKDMESSTIGRLSDTLPGNCLVRRIESTDFTANKYWEELLLLDSQERLYNNILPHITYLKNEQRDSCCTGGVGQIINSRFHLNNEELQNNLNCFLGKQNSMGNFPSLRLRFMPYSEEIVTEGAIPLHRVGINTESWISPSNDIQVHIRARLENHGERYSQFDGRKWKSKFTGWFDNAAAYFYKNGFFGSLGRSYFIWGPEQDDALLLSDNSPAFDRIWLGYEHNAFRFDYLMARLDDFHHGDSTLVRYISAHRLSFRKTGLFELGLSEVALYGGYNRPLEWRFLNPFLPYYWEQYNRGGDDNIFLGLDGSIYWPKQARIFGELMVDDFQIDFTSEPHQVGYKFGIDALEPFGFPRLFTKLSYTRVNTTVYGQNRLQNLYLNAGQPIGYFGGNDQDRLLAMFRYHVSALCDLELECQYNRKGEGRIEQHQSSAVPKGVKFPSGVVEKVSSAQLAASFFHSQYLLGNVELGYAHYSNYQHVCGRSHSVVELDLKLSYFLQGSFD